MGIRIIPLGENTVSEVIKVLLDNGIVCLLSDRVVAGGGVEVDFFGGKAMFRWARPCWPSSWAPLSCPATPSAKASSTMDT